MNPALEQIRDAMLVGVPGLANYSCRLVDTQPTPHVEFMRMPNETRGKSFRVFLDARLPPNLAVHVRPITYGGSGYDKSETLRETVDYVKGEFLKP